MQSCPRVLIRFVGSRCLGSARACLDRCWRECGYPSPQSRNRGRMGKSLEQNPTKRLRAPLSVIGTNQTRTVPTKGTPHPSEVGPTPIATTLAATWAICARPARTREGMAQHRVRLARGGSTRRIIRDFRPSSPYRARLRLEYYTTPRDFASGS